MAYVDEVRRTGYAGGVYFVGAFASGAEVRWATRAVEVTGTLPGLAEERLLSFPSLSYGVGDTWDAELSVPSCTLELDNADGELAAFLLGCDPTDPASSEYSGDSFLNLSGYLVHFVVRDGSRYVQQVSPTLYCERGVSSDDTTITLRMTSRGASDLSVNRFGSLTVRHLLDSEEGAHAAGALLATRFFFTSGSFATSLVAFGSTMTQGEFTAMLAATEGAEDDAADKAIPFVFGRAPFRPVVVGSVPGASATERGWLHVIGFTVQPPAVGTLARWGACPKDEEGWDAYSEAIERNNGTPYALAQIGYIKRDVLCDDGDTRAVWVLFAIGYVRDGNNPRPADRPEIGCFVPAPDSTIGLSTGDPTTPAAIVERIAEDLGAPTLVIESADFDKARAVQLRAHAGGWGGSVYGSARLEDPISVIAGAGHLGVWISRTGALRCIAYPGWGPDELASAAGSLPQIRPSDLLGTPALVEELPTGDNDRGSAASEIAIEWSDEQIDSVPARLRLDRARGGYAPGVRGFPINATIRGDWIFPASTGPITDAVRHRARFSRRLSATTRLWVGTGYDVGQLFRLTATLGRGGAGYDDRLVRLEHVELDFGQDAARCVFEDLGPVEALRAVVLDDEANWVRFNPSDGAPADSITVAAGSSTVTCNNWTPASGALAAGDHLWVWGAANAANRKSVRITGTAAGSFTVEANFAANETIVCSAAGTDFVERAWIIMKSQATKTPTNTTKMAVCDETDLQFRDGSAGFVVSA